MEWFSCGWSKRVDVGARDRPTAVRFVFGNGNDGFVMGWLVSAAHFAQLVEVLDSCTLSS